MLLIELEFLYHYICALMFLPEAPKMATLAKPYAK